MSKLKVVKGIFVGTLLSILIFFSVSFLTILIQINPLHYYKKGELYQLYIGFPFKYYKQYWLSGSEIPNSGWQLKYLFYDCFLTWIIVASVFVLVQRIRNKKRINQ